MALYSRRQLALLLAVLAIAGIGLGVTHLRRAHPDLAERLEQLDRGPTLPDAAGPSPPSSDPPPGRPERTEKLTPAHAVASPSARIDLNRASAPDLMRLPGIGPVLAARIVESRDTEGPYGSAEDLRRVRGLRRGTIDRLRPLLSVD